MAQLIGAQYFYALHGHPVAVLGYMWVIEVHHPQRSSRHPTAHRRNWPSESRLPPTARARRLGYRARTCELEEVIDELPLSPAHEELLGLSALLTVQLTADALMDVFEADLTAER